MEPMLIDSMIIASDSLASIAHSLIIIKWCLFCITLFVVPFLFFMMLGAFVNSHAKVKTKEEIIKDFLKKNIRNKDIN